MHDGGATVTGYKIEKRTTKKKTWETVIETQETKATVGGLVNTEAYHFRVFAKNEKGLSEEALTTEKEVKLPEKPKEEIPPAPEGPLTVSDITESTCKLTWKRPKAIPKSTLVSYNVEKRESKSTNWSSVIKTQETYANVGGLINTEAYHFRVSTETDKGTSTTFLETTTVVKMVKKTVKKKVEIRGRFGFL
uniref:Fibronectin type-III domain-containing protein n=1 Tax=Steinernema glaseri TaxID=37863 RepID=A0A1I7YWV6_9BILA